MQFIEVNAASYGEEMSEFTPSEPLPESELTPDKITGIIPELLFQRTAGSADTSYNRLMD